MAPIRTAKKRKNTRPNTHFCDREFNRMWSTDYHLLLPGNFRQVWTSNMTHTIFFSGLLQYERTKQWLKKGSMNWGLRHEKSSFLFFKVLGGGVKMVASSLPAQGDIIYRRVWEGEERRRSETWTSPDGLPGCPRTAAAQICREAAFRAWRWNIPGHRRRPRSQQILCKKTTTTTKK